MRRQSKSSVTRIVGADILKGMGSVARVWVVGAKRVRLQETGLATAIYSHNRDYLIPAGSFQPHSLITSFTLERPATGVFFSLSGTAVWTSCYSKRIFNLHSGTGCEYDKHVGTDESGFLTCSASVWSRLMSPRPRGSFTATSPPTPTSSHRRESPAVIFGSLSWLGLTPLRPRRAFATPWRLYLATMGVPVWMRVYDKVD